MLPLFRFFPGLGLRLPHLPLGDFPTPVEPLAGSGARLCRSDLCCKCDNVSGAPYGGNKVRKLEFILADAKAKNAVRVITSGAAGSNHALATALYAKRCGLAATLILFDQPPSAEVSENLLMDAQAGAEMIYRERYDEYARTVAELVKHYNKEEGVDPCVIAPGGSSPVGALGFVNAGLELKEQIDSGELPEPGAVFVPLGTMGTAAGLLLGLRAAGLATRLVGVRVTPASLADPEKFRLLYCTTNELLGTLDPAFPDLRDATGEFSFCDDQFEPGYGLASEAVNDAVALIRQDDGITLDHTYTGKAFAALLAEAASGARGPLLFWNTKNSQPFPAEKLARGRERLPAEFRKFLVSGS
jgi:D-cysteine desulfhydrase